MIMRFCNMLLVDPIFYRCCLIFFANCIFFAKTVRYKYCSDDIPVFLSPPPCKNDWHRRFLQLIASVRINPIEDHIQTTILHALTCVLVYLAFGHNDISFLTAFLFAFCPVNNQCSVWISGRWYVIVAICILGSMILPYASYFLLFAASLHPAGWFSPFCVIGSEYWYLTVVALFCILYQIKVIKFMVKRKRDIEAVDEDARMDINRVVVAIKTYGFYAALTIIPFTLTFYHSFLHSMAGNSIMKKKAYSKDRFFYIGLCLIGFLIYSFWHWSPVGWGVLWYSICIAPYTNIYRMQQEIAERYCYIASIGLLYAMANIIIAYPALIAGFMGIYMTRLWVYMDAYMDEYWLVEFAVAEDPGAWYAWHTRARKRFDQGAFREALNMWVMAKMISPKEFKLLLNIGVLLKMIKKDDEAEKFFKQAEDNIIPGQEENARGIIADARAGKMPICL